MPSELASDASSWTRYSGHGRTEFFDGGSPSGLSETTAVMPASRRPLNVCGLSSGCSPRATTPGSTHAKLRMVPSSVGTTCMLGRRTSYPTFSVATSLIAIPSAVIAAVAATAAAVPALAAVLAALVVTAAARGLARVERQAARALSGGVEDRVGDGRRRGQRADLTRAPRRLVRMVDQHDVNRRNVLE